LTFSQIIKGRGTLERKVGDVPSRREEYEAIYYIRNTHRRIMSCHISYISGSCSSRGIDSARPGPMKTGTIDESQRIYAGYHIKSIGFSLERDYPNEVIPDTCCTDTRDFSLQGIFPGLCALLFHGEFPVR
jgi:hypothetical protein